MGKGNGNRGLSWKNWRVMCQNKTVEGTGFRDLEAFNFSFLPKQGWRIMMNLTSLVTRVLKAEYYPCASFIDAKQNFGCSYTCRNITEVWALLR